MPDIITLALISAASFLGATIAVGYLYGLRLLGDWWQGRTAHATAADDAPTGTGVYDWKADDGGEVAAVTKHYALGLASVGPGV